MVCATVHDPFLDAAEHDDSKESAKLQTSA